MKKYRIDLSEFKTKIQQWKAKEGEGRELVETEEIYPLKVNLSNILRTPIEGGIWSNGTEATDAYMLARQFRDCTADFIEINEDEMNLLKKALDKLISKGQIGGEVHEEMIVRIFKAKEII
jgi:hypothetical protein